METQDVNVAEQRAAVIAQIAAMKEQQKVQREALKAAREEAKAKLQAQRDEMKQAREAAKAELVAKREAAKAERESKGAANAEAKLLQAQEKLEKRAEREAAKLEKEKARLEALQNRANANEQNGVREPSVGTETRKLWDILNSMSSAKGAPVAVSELFSNEEVKAMNESTVRTQYSRWKTVHGIVGRVAAA